MKHLWLVSVGIGATTACLIGLFTLLAPSLIEAWEAKFIDLRSQSFLANPPTDHLLLIGRDAESDTRFGVGLWDRAVFAKMITALHRAGAVLVAVDFHFGDESPVFRGGLASDRGLAEAVRSAGQVILPLPIDLQGKAATDPSISPALKAGLARFLPSFDPEVLRGLPQAHHITGPLPELLAVARGAGHIGAISDADGVYRRVPSFVNAGGQAIPSMAVAVAAVFLQVPPERIKLILGRSLTLEDATFPTGNRRTARIPVDEHGNILINYAGSWTDGPFPYLSFVDVWDAIEEKRETELREQVEGKAVLIVHAALGSDKRRTPLEITAPGGFVLANIFDTILNERALRTLSSRASWTMMVLIGTAAAFAMLAFPLGIAMAVIGTIGLAYTVTAILGFASAGLVFPVLLPLTALLVASGGGLALAYRGSTTKIRHLEREQLDLQRQLASTQVLHVQQETRSEELEEELGSARAEAEATQTHATSLEQAVAALERQVQAAQQEADETKQSMKVLEAKLASLKTMQLMRAPLPSEELEQLRQECTRYGIVTRDPGVLRCWKDLKRAARSRTPVMILGEPGTGKELFAQAVHRFSERATQPFVPVNMAAVPPDLFESELFGHLRGSFTGAIRDHDGYFLQAHRGTIFLDEIGDLRAELQAKLLRVVQEQVVTRVGDRKTISIDVRVVSATNRNLLQGIAEGWFREDLYYRLHGIELRLPPLRDRQADVSELVQRFIDEIVAKEGRAQIGLSQAALERLKSWSWKGNVRELKRCVENAVVLAEGPLITEEDLRLDGPVPPSEAAQAGPSVESVVSSEGGDDPKKSDAMLLRLLREHSFDLQATAATLGWDRSTVMQRLKGMCFHALVQTKGDERAAAARLAGDPGLTRLVAVKLREYVQHVRKIVATFPSQEAALAGFKKRFKNLPERYHAALTELVRSQDS